VIRNKIGPAAQRQGLERDLLPAIEVDLKGWQRAHSQGAGLGAETREGILYAPPEVNLRLQKSVENEIREIFEEKAADVDLFLTTETRAHPGTMRLEHIEYRLEAVRGGERSIIFEASIEIANIRVNPRVVVDATKYRSVEHFLR
jgi:hypothetical protein